MKTSRDILDGLIEREDISIGFKGAINRQTTLLRRHDSHDPRWVMCVPGCFNSALDIRQTSRAMHECPKCNKYNRGVKCNSCNKAMNYITIKKCGRCEECEECKSGEDCPNQKTCNPCSECGKCKVCRYCSTCLRYEVLEWTQGTGFNFTKGDTFYDYPLNEGETWSETVRKMQYCIEVTRSSPAIPGKLPPKSPGAEDKSRPRNSGDVEFKLFIPDSNRAGIALLGIKKMTQDEFLKLLITGDSAGVRLKPDGMLF